MNRLSTIKAVLIDLSGTIHVDDEPTPNAIQALEKLGKVNGIHIRFVTNTTKESKDTLLERLHRIGFFTINKCDIYSSLSAAAQYVQANNLRPFYLLSEDAKKDFIHVQNEGHNREDVEDSVVIGLAPDKFNYESINHAFQVLMLEKTKLIGIHEGKYYKQQNGLSVGPGFLTRGFEYVSGKTATIIGKPNEYFFNSAIPNNISSHECCMIGDDINDDVFGAMNIGMKGILVKTGKYIDNIECRYEKQPTSIVETFSDAVDFLLDQNFYI